MTKTVRARYSKGKIEPLEKIELVEGEEVLITITDVPVTGNDFRRAAGSWKGTVDAEKLIRDIYAVRHISRRGEPRI